MSIGIDIPIAQLNTYFAANLWADKTYTQYGRIYRNERDDGIHPEAFNATTKDYEDVLQNDTLNALSFFDVQPDEDYSNIFEATVWIAFAVDLEKLYPLITTERATEYAHRDALAQIKKSNFKVTGLVRGFAAFSDYVLAKPEDSMNEKYYFRFNTTIKYPINC
ncbi:hypothetical protein KAR91_25510 [Candidatus Pacearchaeota archaeon]|nr:hypothetical protein [Candidatus Pacearchaeota archaeon]